jgi:hypothetical protein
MQYNLRNVCLSRFMTVSRVSSEWCEEKIVSVVLRNYDVFGK